MLLLVGTNLAANAHTLSQEIHQLVVALVNLTAQLVQTLCRIMLIAHYEEAEDVIQHLWGNLLLGIAPCIVWAAVALNDESVEAQVHCLLAERSNQVATATDVARVADDWQLWYAAMQLDRNLPHRKVAVNLLVEAGESAVDGTELLDACLVDALQGANPELEVWAYRVLNEHRHVYALKTVGKCLHGEWVGRSTCAYPENVDSIFQCELYMFWGSHLSSCQHACFFLHLLHPRQGCFEQGPAMTQGRS